MRKLAILTFAFLLISMPAFAAKIPDNIKSFIENSYPKTDFRFDGVIILPDGTVYLPLLPAKIITPETLEIQSTYPQNKKLTDKPEIIIFNNDYVLLKVITDSRGNKTVSRLANPPVQVRTGLLPQDMLVPKGLVIPDNLKSITGNLEIKTIIDPGIKVHINNLKKEAGGLQSLTNLAALKNKTIYVASPYTRKIQVYNQASKSANYAFEQKNVPITIKAYNDRFLLVSVYDKPSVDVISLADDQVIKQIFTKTQPDEILIDKSKKIAYISSSKDSCIYMVNLDTMTLFRQIKITGFCEKLTLSADGSKLFYYDKNTSKIWAVELDNEYLLKDIGKFPNVSKILYDNGKIYILSRTKNHLAIVNYDKVSLVAETEVSEKPIDAVIFNNKLYILGAKDNVVEIVDTLTDTMTDRIFLSTGGFSTKIYRIEDTNIALITDTKSSLYTIFDLDTKQVIKTIPLDIPVSSIVVTEKIKKIN